MPRPDASIDFDAYLSSGDRGVVMFYDVAETDAFVPEHVHGDQWGIVLSRTVRMKIGDEMKVCRRGDTYSVPAGVRHATWVEAGTRGIDIFEEHDRYEPRPE